MLRQVELAVLADLLRRRVKEFEQPNLRANSIHTDLQNTESNLQKSQARQQLLEGELAGYEAELAEDRELLDMAAQQSGIGMGEAIRRYKQLKVTVRALEFELESCRGTLSVI